jgi:rhamnosyltransferase
MKCSIIIRSFNEEKHIVRLMEGIKRQTLYADVEVILVDSGSTDKTVALAQSAGAKVVHIEPRDFSFGRALNVGCAAASGEFLLMASAHVYPHFTNWIEKMIAPFADPKIALVYGRQTGNQLTKYSEHQLFKKWFPKHSNYHQEIPFCNNANAVVRRSLWQEQNYDELLTGLEDIDWAMKIQKKGYYIAYESEAVIVHVHEETPAKILNRYRREAIALKKIIPKQNFSILDFLRLSTSNILSDWFHAIQDGVFFRNCFSIFQFRLLQFWGCYIGFKQHGQIDEQLKRRFYYPNQLQLKINPVHEPGERIVYHAGEY